jgi:hypothetical protein
MDFDLIFAIGVTLIAFAIPSAVSAYSDRRWPKTAVLMLLIGAGAVAYAAQENPEDYKDLLVRMAGYSDYFNDMNADLQQEVIDRTENESF